MRLDRLLQAAAGVIVLAGTASADPFTGRYEIVSLESPVFPAGISISGFIEFTDAPTGSDAAFNLAASYVTSFEIIASGGQLTEPLRYTSTSASVLDEVIKFDGALGALVLTPVPEDLNKSWVAVGDLDGQNDGDDKLQLSTGKPSAYPPDGIIRWDILVDSTYASQAISLSPPAWHLVLAVPEPGMLLLLATSGLVLLGRRRRNRT
jgi:hypothetical protein